MNEKFLKGLDKGLEPLAGIFGIASGAMIGMCLIFLLIRVAEYIF